MTEVWTFRLVELDAVPDLTGWDVEATDGHIGKVDEATYEVGSSSLVVDTGFWIFGKKRMIPAGSVQGINPDDKKVYVNLTKDQVKNAPDYEAQFRTEEAYLQRHTDYYGRV